MNTVSVTLTDVEYKALLWDCADPAELFRERARVAVRALAACEVQRRLAAGEGIPTGFTVEDLALASPLKAGGVVPIEPGAPA
jgi:hypothetical protein